MSRLSSLHASTCEVLIIALHLLQALPPAHFGIGGSLESGLPCRWQFLLLAMRLSDEYLRANCVIGSAGRRLRDFGGTLLHMSHFVSDFPGLSSRFWRGKLLF